MRLTVGGSSTDFPSYRLIAGNRMDRNGEIFDGIGDSMRNPNGNGTGALPKQGRGSLD